MTTKRGEMKHYQPFDVTIELTRTYKLRVYGRTPEQAEDEAEQLVNTSSFEDLGEPLAAETRILDVLPAEDSISDATGLGG
jgi:hypothetical protein